MKDIFRIIRDFLKCCNIFSRRTMSDIDDTINTIPSNNSF